VLGHLSLHPHPGGHSVALLPALPQAVEVTVEAVRVLAVPAGEAVGVQLHALGLLL
jgi:hypothetical protein